MSDRVRWAGTGVICTLVGIWFGLYHPLFVIVPVVAAIGLAGLAMYRIGFSGQGPR